MYDSLGNLTEHTTRNGDTIEYEYDIFNRLVKTTSNDGVVTYTYDKNGNILTMTDSTGETEYTYDSMGRILTKTHSVTGTVSYEYDIYTGIPYGYVAEITTEPDGDVVEKWYDSEDKIVKVIDRTDITWYTYYDDGRLKSTTKPDGSVSTNTYDDEGNLLTLVTLDAAEDVLDSFTYVYDDNSIGYKNQISKTEIVAGENKGTTSYEYDIQGRLTKVTNPDESTNEYTYDDAGNRLTKTTTSGETVVVTTYTYDEENRLTQSVTGNSTTYYGYDNNGNQISEWTRITNVAEPTDGVTLSLQSEATDALLTLYEYDAFDRLVKIEQGADVIENTYTADGKKLSRTKNGEVTYYVYDGNVVIEEQDESNNETARNVYGRNLITRETPDNKVVYGYNGHGDVVYYTNLDNIVLVVYDYDEFGNVIREENVVNSVSTLLPSIAGSTETATETIWASIESIDNPYRYAGYEYIEEVKLYDLNARYYNPETARFLSGDPYYNLGNRVIGLYEINVPDAWSIIQANNIYVYCGNNPIKCMDPSGKKSAEVLKWTFGLASGSASIDGFLPYGDIIGGAILVGGGLWAGGMWVYEKITEWNASKEDVVADVATETKSDSQNQTIIYRTGSGSNTNLTPRESKDDNGLSYTTIQPIGEKYTLITVEEINSTGVLVAYQDPKDPNHYLVKAITNHSEWQKSRANAEDSPHIYTVLLSGMSVKMPATN